VPNADFRLKPGMYARMSVTIDSRKDATLVPKAAVVDYDGTRGVFTMTAENKAKFQPVEVGIEDAERVEVRKGVAIGDTVVTGGAAALRNNDTLIAAGQPAGPRGPGGPGGGQGGGRRGPGGAQGGQPAAGPPPGGGPQAPAAPPATGGERRRSGAAPGR
jgi:hypothetical protein